MGIAFILNYLKGAALDQLVMGSSRSAGLRARANAERDQMIKSFKQRRQAQSPGDKAAAMKRAKEHQRKMESLDEEASERIFNGTRLVILLYFIPFS